MTTIYDFSNDGTTMVMSGNDAEGLCFGYSSVWCVKMQKHAGKNQLLTKPAQFEAYPLQQRVEQMTADWEESVPAMIQTWGHECTRVMKRKYTLVARQIAVDQGHYIIDIGDHWVAAAHFGNVHAWFDANEGMITFKNADSFMMGVTKRLQSYKDDPDPDNGWEDTHNIYRIVN